jgi:hypothetical protein
MVFFEGKGREGVWLGLMTTALLLTARFLFILSLIVVTVRIIERDVLVWRNLGEALHWIGLGRGFCVYSVRRLRNAYF